MLSSTRCCCLRAPGVDASGGAAAGVSWPAAGCAASWLLTLSAAGLLCDCTAGACWGVAATCPRCSAVPRLLPAVVWLSAAIRLCTSAGPVLWALTMLAGVPCGGACAPAAAAAAAVAAGGAAATTPPGDAAAAALPAWAAASSAATSALTLLLPPPSLPHLPLVLQPRPACSSGSGSCAAATAARAAAAVGVSAAAPALTPSCCACSRVACRSAAMRCCTSPGCAASWAPAAGAWSGETPAAAAGAACTCGGVVWPGAAARRDAAGACCGARGLPATTRCSRVAVRARPCLSAASSAPAAGASAASAVSGAWPLGPSASRGATLPAVPRRLPPVARRSAAIRSATLPAALLLVVLALCCT